MSKSTSFPFKPAQAEVSHTTGKKEWFDKSFTGEYYTVFFLFPERKTPLGEPAAALEKTIVYLGLVILLALIPVFIPLIVGVRFIHEGRQNMMVVIPGFIWQVLLGLLSIGLGFITVPTLMLLNLGNFFVTLFRSSH